MHGFAVGLLLTLLVFSTHAITEESNPSLKAIRVKHVLSTSEPAKITCDVDIAKSDFVEITKIEVSVNDLRSGDGVFDRLASVMKEDMTLEIHHKEDIEAVGHIKPEGGSGEMPCEEGSGEMPCEEGSGEMPCEDGSGEMPCEEGSGEMPCEEGSGEMPCEDGSGEMPCEEGSGEMPCEEGSGEMPCEEGSGEMPCEEGSGEISGGLRDIHLDLMWKRLGEGQCMTYRCTVTGLLVDGTTETLEKDVKVRAADGSPCSVKVTNALRIEALRPFGLIQNIGTVESVIPDDIPALQVQAEYNAEQLMDLEAGDQGVGTASQQAQQQADVMGALSDRMDDTYLSQLGALGESVMSPSELWD